MVHPVPSFNRGVGRALIWGGCLLAAGVLRGAEPVRINEVAITPEHGVRIQHTAHAGSYYILYRGEDPARILLPVDLQAPLGASGVLIDPAPPPNEAFYSVREVLLSAPLDTDGDGWPDEAELMAGSNPLDAASRPVLAVMAHPALEVIAPRAGFAGGIGWGLTAANASVEVIVPRVVFDGSLQFGPALARIEVEVIAPRAVFGGEMGFGLSVAAPPVEIVAPRAAFGPGVEGGVYLATPPVTVEFTP